MHRSSEERAWHGLAGDLFRRAFSFGLSADQLAHVAAAIAVERGDTNIEKSVFNGAHSPAIWFLTGFAFELFLKSAIVASGGSAKDVKSIGHNLIKALEDAENRGLKVSDDTRFSIGVANRAHYGRGENGFFFRYGDGASAEVQNPEAMIASLKELLGQTALLVNQPNATFDTFLVPFQLNCSE
jgi:hypothetical protein